MRRAFFIMNIIFMTAFPAVMFASAPPQDKETALNGVYASRKDLHALFDAKTREATADGGGFLVNLDDWARQYGWREYKSLSSFAPTTAFIPQPKRGKALSDVGAKAFIVIDRASGLILAEKDAGKPWPIASITKLVTADVVLATGVARTKIQAVEAKDDVGGAKLYVQSGTGFTVDDLFYAALVGSANNAANALSRSTGLNRDVFVAAMNKRASDLHLVRTHFVDPSGIEPGNVSTPRELALLVSAIFSRPEVKSYTSTAKHVIHVQGTQEIKQMKSTDWLLWKPEHTDVYVTSGKTGFLDESGWNFAVSLRKNASDRTRELLIVVFGADSRADSFTDTKKLATWTWASYVWKKH